MSESVPCIVTIDSRPPCDGRVHVVESGLDSDTGIGRGRSVCDTCQTVFLLTWDERTGEGAMTIDASATG